MLRSWRTLLVPLATCFAILSMPKVATAQCDLNLIETWVYPSWGNDQTGAINSPASPFKSMQAAIDASWAHLRDFGTDALEDQAVVWCMPGVYGPVEAHGSNASGDYFPIKMQHRVHVKGVNARRCIIRGVKMSDPLWSQMAYEIFWPDADPGCDHNIGDPQRQVLVSYQDSSQYLPESLSPFEFGYWSGQGEVAEILDGFTFQVRTPGDDDPVDTGRMAMIGIGATDSGVRSLAQGGGYVETNAFAPGRAGSSSALFISPPVATAVVGTIDMSAGLANPPWNEDVLYDVGLTPNCHQDPPPPVSPLCLTSIAVPAPAPGVYLWNGSASATSPQEMDPAFVGEYLVSLPNPNPVLGDYADWRIVPGSPLIDAGRLWEDNEFENGEVWNDYPSVRDSQCEDLRLDRWDGEGYGNTRTHGANVDIGFDEVQLTVMAGSYANGSSSHNRSTHLNPMVGASQSERRVLLPLTAGGVLLDGATLSIKSVEEESDSLPIPPATFPGWNVPPVTLSRPLTNPNPPVGYQAIYIDLANEAWSATVAQPDTWNVVAITGWLDPFDLYRIELPPDDEGPNFTSWFNTQAVVHQIPGQSGLALIGNLQAEYR